MSATEQPGLDPEEIKTFTSRKMDWLNGISIDPEMTSHDFQVAFCIAQCMSVERGVGTIADDTIAVSTGTTRRHVLESRKKLRARGWLDWRNTRTANVYVLLHGLVEAMIDLRTDLRDQRAEARLERLPARRFAKSTAAIDVHAVNPSAQLEDITVNPSAQLTVQPSSQHAVNPSAHIHLHCSTLDIHPQNKKLSEEDLEVREEEPETVIVEEPFPAVDHPQIAETMLIQELGEGDSERGVFVASRIGDARFKYLHRELMGGTLLPSAVRAASACLHDEEAA